MRCCALCGESIDGRRPQAKYCSGSCRAAVSRERRAERASDACLARNTSGTEETAQKAHTGFIGGPCPDPNRCRHYMRHASGPWTCEFNHPRVAAKEVEAAAYASVVRTPADYGRAPRLVREDAQ